MADAPVGVKICGLREPEDAVAAAEAGAAYVGFVFATGRRRVDPAAAAAAAREVRGVVRPVGVFVDAPISHVQVVAGRVGLEVAQLHGEEMPVGCAAVRELGLEVWKAVRPRSREALDEAVRTYRGAVDGLLVEGYSPEAAGGTGTAFPHAWLEGWRERFGPEAERPVLVLAGGLTPESVGEAVRDVRPDVVDVSSGVERSPGVKDAERIRRFVRRAHAALGVVRGDDGG